MLKLGFLDFGTVLPGNSRNQVLKNTIDYAVLAEKAGFERYWLAEHHNETAAWAGPEIAMGLMADHTEKIRIGSAGILLNLYSPAKVAENFKLLNSLAHGRIDLGIGQGVVKDEHLNRFIGTEIISNDSYTDKVKTLLNDLSGQEMPQVWILGSGDFNANLAAKTGSAFAYSLFIKARKNDPDIIKKYKNEFIVSLNIKKPIYNVTVAGVCAETEEKAKELAKRYPNDFVDVKVVGTPEMCKEMLLDISNEYETDEIIFLDASIEHNDRVNTIRLLSEIL